MPIQVQIITAFLVLRGRMDDAWRRVREDRGELTGSAIRAIDPCSSRDPGDRRTPATIGCGASSTRVFSDGWH